MSSKRLVRTVSATLIMSGLLPTLALAQSDPPQAGPEPVDRAQALKDAAIVNIPLLLSDVDTSGASGTLWVKGDQPGNNLLARLTARPVQVAVMQADGNAPAAGEPQDVLWRAMPGDKDSPAHAGWLNLKDGARIFCGPAAPRTLACWIDGDGNGEFDQVARALPERGGKPYHITIIAPPRKLDAPRPYRILPDDERPKIPIEVRNCDKDHDRPRFSALSTADRNTPVAYGDRLTQDVTINTLLYKRSVAAGTVVYGFPARMQLSLYRGSVPMSMQTNDSEYRDAGMDLIWCAPVQGPPPTKEDQRSMGRNGWSAACIPHGTLGNHTVLTDLQPAFNVGGVAYDANTSSNDGRPPIVRDDKAEFGAPLRMIYVYDGLDGKDIRLLRQIYFGDSLTSQSVVKITPAGRLASAEISGGKADFSITDDAELVVKQASAPVPGVEAGLKWDQSLRLREQLKKMGLKLSSPEDGE